MKRLAVLALVALAAGCNKPGGAAGGSKSGGGACAGGKVDLAKMSGDWISKDTIKQPDGNFPGNQYRVRIASVGADGSVKALLAWRLDSRPFTGTLKTNSMGGEIELLEDMTPETIAQLKKSNNPDPHLPMRAVLRITPEETGCGIEIVDAFQTFMGDKVTENTSPLGLLHLVPAPAGTIYSFVRCDVPKGIYFDGKADDGRMPVTLAPGKSVAIKAEADKAAFPKECSAFDADVFVDGIRTAEKVAGKADSKEVVYEAQITLQAGPPHGVELHAYAECPNNERRLVAAACNYALTE